MNKKTLFIILSVILVMPTLVFATVPPLIATIISSLVNVALYIASGVIVILWVVTGVLFLTAQGQPEKMSTAKKALIASVVGTILIIVAQGAIVLVGSAFSFGGAGGGYTSGGMQGTVQGGYQGTQGGINVQVSQ